MRNIKTIKKPQSGSSSDLAADNPSIIKSLKTPPTFSRSRLLLFAAIFAAVGGYLLYRTFAAETVVASLEVEQMILPSGAREVTDVNASSGKAIRFTSSGTATASVNLPVNTTGLKLVSKSKSCYGRSPSYRLSVDGTTVVSRSVNSSIFSSYSVTKELSSGNHSISLRASMPFSFSFNSSSCTPELYLDVVTFTGSSAPTPMPTISFSASPPNLTAGSSSTLNWNAANATSCDASGAWSGSKPVSGSASTGALNVTTTYNLVCQGEGGNSSASVTINVSPVVPPSSSSGSSLGLLRINPNEVLPADLSKYSVLLLDSGRHGQVAGLKSKYPKLKVLAYKDLTFVCDYSVDAAGNTGVSWPQAQANPSWFLLNPSGQRQASIPFSKCYFMDPNSASYQQTWASNVVSWLKQAPWDGVFMDDTNADNGYHLNSNRLLLTKYPTRDSYRGAVRNLLAYTAGQVKANGYLAIPNIDAAWDQPDVWADWSTLASGAMREHFLKWGQGTEPVFRGADWKIHTDVARSVMGANRMFVGLTYGAVNDDAKQRYVMASFLLFYQPSTSSVGMWSVNDGPAFNIDLGAPSGSATQNGSVWTRKFERGTITVDTAAGTASVSAL